MRGNGEAKKRERRRGVVATRLVGHKRHESGKKMDTADDASSSPHDSTCRKSPLDLRKDRRLPDRSLDVLVGRCEARSHSQRNFAEGEFLDRLFSTEIFNWTLRGSWGQPERGPGWKINCPSHGGAGAGVTQSSKQPDHYRHPLKGVVTSCMYVDALPFCLVRSDKGTTHQRLPHRHDICHWNLSYTVYLNHQSTHPSAVVVL